MKRAGVSGASSFEYGVRASKLNLHHALASGLGPAIFVLFNASATFVLLTL